jgi:endonuclease/exonuclease/phosphatase family metal-dependent hydrolase
MRYFILLLFSLSIGSLWAQSDRIILDENLDDWQNIAPAANDPLGDNGSSYIDFGRLWISNDEDFIFFRLEVGTEINIQSDNEITLFLDTDNNSDTGLNADGIGAELVYNFGNRVGAIYTNNNNTIVAHEDIRLFTSPTVTSEVFEIAIGRDLTFSGQSIFQGDEIKALIKNNILNGDKIPNANGGISYTFNNNTPTPLPEFSISRLETAPLRVMSYNVLFDQLFDNGVQANYERIFKALQPDIIGFQEIYDHSAQQTANKVASFLPLSGGAQWHTAKVPPDIIAVSKYPIISSHLIGTSSSSNSGNGAFLIDLNSATDTKLLFVVAHPPCCDNEEDRQKEFDALMAFIRKAKAGTGPAPLSPNDPIIVLGDMNLVGLRQQQLTLITGDIVDENNYGPDFHPDWNGADFEDAKPLATNLPLSITWYDEGTSYSPGRLDYLVYTSSVLNLENTFSLFTPALSSAELVAYDLQANDVLWTSDHLPVVGDFTVDFTTSTKPELSFINQDKLAVLPNPLIAESQLSVTLHQTSKVVILLLDVSGRACVIIHEGELSGGQHLFKIDKSQLSSGIYFCQLKTDTGIVSQKIVVF